MRIAFAPAKYEHENALLDALAESCRALGHEVGWPFVPDLVIQWGGKKRPDGYPTLHCELGWLPRWHYQISWNGINAKHHAAGKQSRVLPFSELCVAGWQVETIRSGRGMPRAGWGYCDPTVEPWPGLSPFWLCPLQVPTDVNMDSLPYQMRTAQGLIDYIVGLSDDPHWGQPIGRIYFKQHPALSERGQELRIPPPHKYLQHSQRQVASYLKSPNCLGVICGNSNVFHDALLWGKTAIALGDGFWGKGPVTMEPGTDETNAYLRHVLANQWTLEMARDPARVAVLIGDALNGEK